LDTHSKYRTKPLFVSSLYALLGLSLYLFAVIPFGQGFTDDSVNFFAAAISFPPQLLKLDENAFVEWPPLYPILISGYKIFNIPPLLMGVILHAISILITIHLIGLLLFKYIRSNFIQHIALLVTVFSIPILIIHVFAWSEGIFTMLYIMLIFQLEQFLSKKYFRHFILATLVAIFISFQRKSGIILDLSAALTILFLLKGKSFFKRLQYAIVFFVLSIVPFLLYLNIRQSHTGKYFTYWNTNFSLLVENCLQSLEVMTSWLLPDELPLPFRIILIVLFIASFWLVYFQSKKFKKPEINTFQGLLIIHLLCYTSAIIIIFLFLKLDQPFDDRIFAPVYPVFLILFFSFIDKFYYNLLLFPIKSTRALGWLFIALLSLWSLYPISRTVYTVYKWNQYGVGGYNHQNWRENPLIQFLDLQPVHTIVKSNNRFAIFYHMVIVDKTERRPFINSDIANKPYLYACFEPCESQEGKILINTNQGKIFYISE
jgi:hypothetical protein